MGNDRFSKEGMRAVGNNSPFEKRGITEGFGLPLIHDSLSSNENSPLDRYAITGGLFWAEILR
jgi:hypothetical protein